MNLSFDGIGYVSTTTKKKKLLGEKMNTKVWLSWLQWCPLIFLAEQLQVRHRHFSFLISSFPDEPVRVHPRHSVNCDKLISQ